jgi:hypothetical protein
VSIRNKRFTPSQNAANKIKRDNQPTIDEQLTRFEEDIRRLKIEFDIYFNGASKRPPYDTKNRVETIIKRLGDDRSFTFAQRFRYNTLVARYTAFREMWRRTIQDREEGRGPLAAKQMTRNAEEHVESSVVTFSCSDGHRDVETVKKIFDALVEAKQQCGDRDTDISFPRFHHLIASRTDKLKESTNCARVQFSIEIENGQVSLKAKAEEN